MRMVTTVDFARFIRSGQYFERRHWDADALRHRAPGGDEVLRRIGYRGEVTNEPVGNVSWFEANAYCRWQMGRLPWSFELEMPFPVRPFDVPGTWSEWCGEWFSPGPRGPKVRPAPGERGCRRIANGPLDHAVPELRFAAVGFRVVRGKE